MINVLGATALAPAAASSTGSTDGWTLSAVLLVSALPLLVYIGLAVAAIVSVLRSPYRASIRLLVVLAILAYPFVGSLVWLVWGRRPTGGGARLAR